MSLAIYKVEQTLEQYDGELGEKELTFLNFCLDENDGTYYIYPDLLEDAVATVKKEDLPEGLVEFLRGKVADGNDYWFAIS